MYKERKYNKKGNPKGRGIGTKNLTNKDILNAVGLYIENGNYSEVARQMGVSRICIYRNVANYIERYPEEYKKMVDAFVAKNKMIMIHQNASATQKALEKVDELLDDTTSLKEAAMAYGILYDKGALMKGEATSNNAVVIKMAGDISELAQ